ncbi:MAG: DUF4012 domain-containing protein [Candidatus Levybacteria bacterium]|nr:DUF4012 domain-containing protein [Candidatus Levybacteria bacterium]
MEGFEKINLGPTKSATTSSIKNTPKDMNSNSASRSYRVGSRKNLFKFLRSRNGLTILVVVVLLLIISSFAIVLPAQKTLKSARIAYKQAQIVADAVKKQNVELASQELVKAKADLAQTQKDLNSFSYAKFIPIVGLYYNDADRLVKAGIDGLEAAIILVDSVKPYADVLGLKGQGSFVGGTAEQRIQTVVKTMGKVTPHIDDVSKYLEDAKTQVDGINPSRYPSFLGLGKIQKTLKDLKTAVDGGATFVEEARPLIKILPSLLGEPDSKKYLILFQNDKELRPTGGFITAYSVFRLDRGAIHVEKSENIYNLDLTIRNKPKAPDPILDYLPRVSLFNLRDSNLSPDFVESMKTFNSLYDKASVKVDVDGIIALDTNVLVSTIKILDDRVDAGGMTFTTQIDKRCDCPQVIYQLESTVSTPLSLDLRVSDLEAIQASRKDIIGELLFAILTKSLKSSPKLYWGPLFQNLITQIDQKHVMFYVYNKDAQRGFEALNAAGRIKAFKGDYLHINEANFGGAKSNLFVSRSVTQNYEVKNSSIIKTVTVNYKNPYPPSDCNLERGNLCLNAVLRNWFRIYVPKGSKLVDVKGSEVKMKTYDELGKTVFEGFLTVRPQGTATLILSYTLPMKADASLPLLIQKQPGTVNDEYIVKVNNKQKNKFELLTDKEFKINLK